MLWTHDGTQFLCCDETKINVISIKSLEVDRIICDDDSVEDIIYTFVLTDNDEALITAHRSGLLRLWSFETGKLQKSWKNLHIGPVNRLEYSSNVKLLASGGADSFMRIWDFQKQVCKGTLKGAQGVISVIKFHSTESVVLGAGDDATILAWNYETREIVKIFSGHISKVTSLNFSQNEKLLVSSSRDKVS